MILLGSRGRGLRRPDFRCFCVNNRERISLDGSIQLGSLDSPQASLNLGPNRSLAPHAPPISQEQLDSLAEIIRDARKCVVLTGRCNYSILQAWSWILDHSTRRQVHLCCISSLPYHWIRSMIGLMSGSNVWINCFRCWREHRVQYPRLQRTTGRLFYRIQAHDTPAGRCMVAYLYLNLYDRRWMNSS